MLTYDYMLCNVRPDVYEKMWACVSVWDSLVFILYVWVTIQKQEAVMIKHESRAFVCLFLCVH